MARYTQHRYEMPQERYEGLLARLERRTRTEHRKQLRNAALASGISGGLVSGNYYLAGGTLLWAAIFGFAAMIGCAVVLLLEALGRAGRAEE